MRKIGAAFLCVLSVLALSGCASYSPSDSEYWFTSSSTRSIEYDAAEDNIETAGTYWDFVSARSENIRMNVRLDVDNFTSAAYLYVNGEQVKSELDTGIYTYVYALSLKKGDELSLHAFYVNPLSYDEKTFQIDVLSITAEDGNTYLLSDFGKNDNTERF